MFTAGESNSVRKERNNSLRRLSQFFQIAVIFNMLVFSTSESHLIFSAAHKQWEHCHGTFKRWNYLTMLSIFQSVLSVEFELKALCTLNYCFKLTQIPT